MADSTDIQTALEERFAALVTALIGNSPAAPWLDLTGVAVKVQKGVDDSTITAPCVICFSDNCKEAIYGKQVFDATLHVQLQTFISETAALHKQRVDAMNQLFYTYTPSVQANGSYRALQAALCDAAHGLSVEFVKPMNSVAGVDDDKWIYTISFMVIAQWYTPSTP